LSGLLVRFHVPEDPGSVALLIVHACLAAGAAGYVTYASAEAKPSEP
jgi:hypothetical protein